MTQNQKQLLDLGTKFNYKPKFDPLKKETELEILYDSLTKLASKQLITIHPNLKPQLKAEATKNRDFKHSSILTKELRTAAKELKSHPNIIVRRADKANSFVILDRAEYKDKLDAILADKQKFTRISRNPIASLKTKVNKLIAEVNRNQDEKIIKPIIGEFHPGYIYGTVKTHKPNNPLRPIVSQVTTPIYETAKKLNTIITPYLPAKYQINSTDDFLQIIRATNPQGIIASLDVESLFTNVPVLPTIEIICNAAYNHASIPPPGMGLRAIEAGIM